MLANNKKVPRIGPNYKNFQPRVGFAYNPSFLPGMVIRGGFAINYDPAFYNLMLNAQTAAPVVFAYSLSSNIIPMPSNITGANLQSVYAPPAGVDPRTLSQSLFPTDFKSPYSISYSLGFQRRIS